MSHRVESMNMSLAKIFLLSIPFLVLVSCDAKDSVSNPSPPTGSSDLSAASNAAADNKPRVPAPPASGVREPLPTDTIRSQEPHVDSRSFVANETVFVTATHAIVDIDETIITLPIGSSAIFKNSGETCSDETSSSKETICVYVGDIYNDAIDEGFPEGKTSAAAFSRTLPRLQELLAEYDYAPKENQDLRRELAEKASTLDPWSDAANKRLIEILNELGDRKAADAAQATYRRYKEHVPQIADGELPTIFHYDGERIFPFAMYAGGEIKRAEPTAASHRGTFLYVYGERRVGITVTKQSFSCGSRCPSTIPIQNIGSDGKPTAAKLEGVYATNFLWPERAKARPAVTRVQKAELTRLLSKAAANLSGKKLAAARKVLKSGAIDVMAGQLSEDGRYFLIGGFHVGSASDEHYSDGIFVSKFVVLEQQPDGSLSEASVDMSDFEADYCNVSRILRDMDGDGTDEIVTYCNSFVEGPYDEYALYHVMHRVNNQWVKAF